MNLAGGPREGRYANYLEVGYNAFEFLLDFGQFYPEGGKPQLHTRIVTGPAYAKTFLEILQQSVEQYEESFGAISPTDIRLEDDES